LHESGEVVARVGDGGEAEGGGVPGEGFVEFGDGDVEAVLDFFFQAADDLAAVLEGVSVLDAELDREGGYGHCFFIDDGGWEGAGDFFLRGAKVFSRTADESTAGRRENRKICAEDCDSMWKGGARDFLLHVEIVGQHDFARVSGVVDFFDDGVFGLAEKQDVGQDQLPGAGLDGNLCQLYGRGVKALVVATLGFR
jgi:hypothetical protein